MFLQWKFAAENMISKFISWRKGVVSVKKFIEIILRRSWIFESDNKRKILLYGHFKIYLQWKFTNQNFISEFLLLANGGVLLKIAFLETIFKRVKNFKGSKTRWKSFYVFTVKICNWKYDLEPHFIEKRRSLSLKKKTS